MSNNGVSKPDREDSPTKEDLEKLGHREQICFAIDCAESVFHLVANRDKAVCRASIDAAIGFLEGKVSAEECNSAAYAAAGAYAAAYAAKDKQSIIAAQWTLYDELLSLDSHLVSVLN